MVLFNLYTDEEQDSCENMHAAAKQKALFGQTKILCDFCDSAFGFRLYCTSTSTYESNQTRQPEGAIEQGAFYANAARKKQGGLLASGDTLEHIRKHSME
ncbi:hypothetical protein ACLOJK_011921 [Asimina triloba]